MGKPSYYYSGGKRIALEPDERTIAVDLRRARAAASPQVREWAERSGGLASVKDGIALVPRAEIPAEVLAGLDQEGAIHPVFRYGRARIVVLPEVRVEVAGAEEQRLRRALEKGDFQAEVEHDDGERLVLRPRSGRGIDALALANALHEKVAPSLAQARFLRIVPKP